MRQQVVRYVGIALLALAIGGGVGWFLSYLMWTTRANQVTFDREADRLTVLHSASQNVTCSTNPLRYTFAPEEWGAAAAMLAIDPDVQLDCSPDPDVLRVRLDGLATTLPGSGCNVDLHGHSQTGVTVSIPTVNGGTPFTITFSSASGQAGQLVEFLSDAAVHTARACLSASGSTLTAEYQLSGNLS